MLNETLQMKLIFKVTECYFFFLFYLFKSNSTHFAN